MLKQIIKAFGVELPEYVENTITPRLKEVNIAGIQFPFYGDILDTEKRFYKDCLVAQKDLIERFQHTMIKSGCSMSYSIDQFKMALRLGNLKFSEFEIVDIPWDILGWDKLNELAKELGVENFVEVSSESALQIIIIDYFAIWKAAGISGNTGLEMANNVLNKILVIKEVNIRYEDINTEEILKISNLNWSQIEIIDDISDPYFMYRVLILLRTDRGDFNPFNYLVSFQKQEIIQLFEKEIVGVKPEIDEPIHVNENVETDQGNETEEMEIPPPQEEEEEQFSNLRPTKTVVKKSSTAK
jgi:hypothetical protein